MPQLLNLYWSWVAVAVVVYMLGQAVKKTVVSVVPDGTPSAKWPVWYHLWNSTLPIQPVAAAALFGFVPLPVPSYVTDVPAKLLYFSLAGAFCGQVFEIVKRGIAGARVFGEAQRNGRSTPPPAAPPAAGEGDRTPTDPGAIPRN